MIEDAEYKLDKELKDRTEPKKFLTQPGRVLMKDDARVKYCPEMVDRICKLIEQGCFRTVAATLVDISYDTFLAWIKDKPGFLERVKKAEGKLFQRNAAVIQTAALKSWQAAAWWFERTMPDAFALHTKQEVQGYIESAEGDLAKKERLNTLKLFMHELSKKKTKKAEPNRQVPPAKPEPIELPKAA